MFTILRKLSIATVALVLLGCGTSDTIIKEGNTTIVVNLGDSNTTVTPPTIVMPPLDEIPSLGYVNSPYPFFESGSYLVNYPKYGATYFISNIIDTNMTLKVNPKITNVVYDVVLYDDLYNTVDAVTYIGEWTFLIPAKGFYNIEIKSYDSVEVVLSVDGWN